MRQQPPLGKAGQSGQGGHVNRFGQFHPPAIQIKRYMIGKIKQCLQRLFEPQQFCAERGGIGIKVEIACAGQPLLIRHGDLALKLDRIFKGQMRSDEICARRHHHCAPRRRRIRRIKRRAVIGDAIADGSVIAHIQPIEHF